MSTQFFFFLGILSVSIFLELILQLSFSSTLCLLMLKERGDGDALNRRMQVLITRQRELSDISFPNRWN